MLYILLLRYKHRITNTVQQQLSTASLYLMHIHTNFVLLLYLCILYWVLMYRYKDPAPWQIEGVRPLTPQGGYKMEVSFVTPLRVTAIFHEKSPTVISQHAQVVVCLCLIATQVAVCLSCLIVQSCCYTVIISV
jgi:hypothetical protein